MNPLRLRPTPGLGHGQPARRQRGTTVLVVLVLLAVMLMGGLSLARMTDLGTLASGNVAAKEASVQASEVGLNTAFAAVRALPTEDGNQGSWYFGSIRPADAHSVPTVDWTATPEIEVGRFRVRYVAERMCVTDPVTDSLRQCLVKQIPQRGSLKDGEEDIDPPNSRQFRITIRVTDGKGTQTWVQSLVTKG
ncbi:MAG: hypothetical protein ACKVQR_00135 [Aquabacterium sp.]